MTHDTRLLHRNTLLRLTCVISLVTFLLSGCGQSREARAKYIRALAADVKSDTNKVSALRELVDIASSNNSFNACYATVAMGDLGEDAAPVVPDLERLLDSQHAVVRREAARSLGKLGPVALPALDRLAREVEEGSPYQDSTWFAAQAIGLVGKEGAEYLPLLRSKLGTGTVQFDDCLTSSIELLEESASAED